MNYPAVHGITIERISKCHYKDGKLYMYVYIMRPLTPRRPPRRRGLLRLRGGDLNPRVADARMRIGGYTRAGRQRCGAP
jgi:hypothetical protein